MELNELFLVLIIIALVVLLLSAIYKFGMSRKSFEEILEEQMQSQISLLGKPKPEKKKEKKKQPTTVNKKKSEKSAKSEDDASHDEELLTVEKSKEMKTVVEVSSASKPVKRKVAKEHQEYNKVEELLVKEKTIKEKNDKISSVDTKLEKNDNSITFGPATTKKVTIVNSVTTKDQSILKSVAPATTDKISSAPRPNSKSPVTKTTTRSTDAGPVNTDAKKKKNKEAEVAVSESEKIVAAAAPITKSTGAVSHKEHREHTGAEQLSKGLDTKPDTHNLQKSSLVIRETTGNVKLTTTGPPSPTIGSEWTAKNQKGDPNVALKKLLDERDGELRMLQAQLQAANAKYNEARRELADNNQKFTAHDRTLKQQLSVKEQECVELRKRVSSGSGASSGPIKGPSNDGQVQVIMHLTEENRQLKETILKLQQQVGQAAGQQQQQQGADLKQQIKFMDEALKQNSMLLNTSENARKALELKLKQSEDQLQTFNRKATDLEKRCHDAEDRLAKKESSNKSLVNEGELKAYQAKLKEKELQTTELETQMKLLENKFSQLQQRLQNQDAELLSLRSGNGQSVNLSNQGRSTESNRETDLLQQCDHLAGELESSKNAMHQLELSNNEKSEELRKAIEELNMLKMSHARDVQQQNERIADVTTKLDEQSKIVAKLESIEKEKTLEIEATKQQLQSIKDKCNDADLQLERYSEVSNDLDRAKENLMRLESMNEEKSNELRKLSEEMSFYRSSQSDIESKDFQLRETIEEINKCKQTIEHLQAELVRKDQDLDKLKQDSSQHMLTLKTAQKDEYDRLLKDLEAQNEELKKFNYEKVCENCSSKQKALDSEELQQTFIPNGSSHLNSDNSEEVEGYKATISKLEEESGKKSQELQRVNEELELLRISNNDLVNQSQRLLEASDCLEKSKVDLHEVEQRSRTTSVDDADNIPLDVHKLSQLSNEVVRYKEDVEKLKRLSDEKHNELEKVRKELNDVKRANEDLSARIESTTNNFKDVPDSSFQTNGLEVQLVEAKEAENKLQSEVQHYQTVLHDTERILRQLQDNVESEEQNWQQKLLSSQNQLHEYVDKIRQLERLLEESEMEKKRLEMNQDLTNGTSPSIDHKEERIRKADRAVVCPALEAQEMN